MSQTSDNTDGIEGYASATSVNIGDSIDFRVSVASGSAFTVTIHRMGFHDGGARLTALTTTESLPGPTADATTLTASDWRLGWTLTVPSEWTSGLYVAEFTTVTDPATTAGAGSAYTPFVVRDDARAASLCMVLPFVSFQAENQWPDDGTTGKSLSFGYDEDGNPSVRDRAVKVSFDRPYAGNGLPSGLEIDRRVIAWAEESGYDLSYVSDVDVHAGRVDLSRFAGVIFTGDARYWSAEMRSAVTNAVSSGTSVAFLSAATMFWHVRLEDSADGQPDRTVVCYKHTPDPDTRPGMATMKWRVRDPGPGNAEQSVLGVQHKSEVASPRPLSIANADHWFWKGTGLWEADEIADLVAGDADAYDARYELPAGMSQTLLSASPFRTVGGAPEIQNTSVCEAPDGTLVFTAGTGHWAFGLGDAPQRDDRLRLAMANLVARMVAPRSAEPSDSLGESIAVPAGNRVAMENRAAGSATWRVGRAGTRANDELHPQVHGYASTTSAAAGSVIEFHVSVAEPQDVTISVYRVGNYGGVGARHLLDSPVLAGTPQSSPQFDEATGRLACDWAASWRLDIPGEWVSGVYVAAFTTASGFRSLAPFVVRDDARRDASTSAPICVVLPFLTYQASNRWPLDTVHGKSLGHGYAPGTGLATANSRAVEVSFDRPYPATGLPAKAYIDIDVVTWLERNGYDVTYASDIDIHDGSVDARRFSGLLFLGQSEYWTRSLRDAVTAAGDEGTSRAFLGAGTCLWHARLEPAADGRPNRVIACYKTEPDPHAHDTAAPDDGSATTRWRATRPGPAAPEQTLVGVQLRGSAAQSADLVVANADHWFWAGTGATTGAAIEGMVRSQVDAVDAGAGSPPSGVSTVLAISPFVTSKGSTDIQNTIVWESPNGATIFAAGTEMWMLGLGREAQMDTRVQTATRNLLDRMTVASRAAAGAGRPGVMQSRPTSPITLENACRGSRAWRIGADGTVAGDDRIKQIAGYASATSVAIGDSIDFHVTVNPAGLFTVGVYRMGYYQSGGARLLTTSPELDGVTCADPRTIPQTRSVTCDWPVSWTLDVPDDWTSGLYYAVFTSEQGYRSFTPFVVRDPSQRDNLCVVLPFTTYQAHNTWPLDGATGRDLNLGYMAELPDLHAVRRSHAVSFDRPYFHSGQPTRIAYDLAFIRWAEEANIDLTYATDIDLHAGRIDPEQYAGLVFCGQDEYWSGPMHEHATAALSKGTSLAFLGAKNIYWHARIHDAADGRRDRSLLCHKEETDLDLDASAPGVTDRWRNGRPAPHVAEQQLLGVQHAGSKVRPSPLIVHEPDHWLWEGTGVAKGEAIEGVVGGEVDGYDPRYPRPQAAVTLARSPYEPGDGGRFVHETCLYETDLGAVVFASGTNEWVSALGVGGRVERRIQRATANLLDRMQAPRLATRSGQIAHLDREASGLDERAADTFGAEAADEPEASGVSRLRTVFRRLR